MADDVYLVIGQSNAAGRDRINLDDDNNDVPSPYVDVLAHGNSTIPAMQPLNQYSTIRKALHRQGVCLGLEFGKRMSKHTSRRILLVVNARGGSRIAHWRKDNTRRGYFQAAVERVRLALMQPTGEASMVTTTTTNNTTNTNSAIITATTMTTTATTPHVLRGIVWHQGESDIRKNGTYSDSYFTKHLPALIQEFRREFDHPTLPFVVGQVFRTPQTKALNQAIRRVRKSNSKSFPLNHVDWVSSEKLTSYDNLHFDSISSRKLGRRYAKRMKRLLISLSLL